MSGEILVRFSLIDTSNPSATAQQLLQKFVSLTGGTPDLEDDDDSKSGDDEGDASSEIEDSKKEESAEKKEKKLKMKKMKRRATLKGYEFTGSSEVAGVLFLEIVKVTDLPPERNGKFNTLIGSSASNSCVSHQDLVRHGSLRRYLSRKEDLQNPCHQTQPESSLRREASVSSSQA